VRKVKWSSEELAYIDLWMSRDDGDASSLAVSRCLTSIRAADNDTKAIFHPHHVLNSARLRNGFERVLKMKKMEVESLVLSVRNSD